MVQHLLLLPPAPIQTAASFTNTSKGASVNTENIWINDCSGGGINIYMVMRGHSVYDEFVSTKPLTWKQQDDIIEQYKEALAHYNKEDA
jgi:hypothetical protein